jgi:hypothetical protein
MSSSFENLIQKIIVLRFDNLHVPSNAKGQSRYRLGLPEFEKGAVHSDEISRSQIFFSHHQTNILWHFTPPD